MTLTLATRKQQQQLLTSNFIFVASLEISENCRDDWYVPRTNRFKRSQLLTFVYMCKDIIRNSANDKKNVEKKKYDDLLMELGESGSALYLHVKNLDWQSVRYVLRAMLLKYKNEQCHEKFEIYVALSRRLWRDSL